MERKVEVISVLKKFFIYFVLYAIIGWLYEVFLELFIYNNGFINRGELFGPYCPVYGFGATLFLVTAYPVLKKKSLSKKLLMIPLIFLWCMFTATLVELITSYLCEFFMGRWLWQTYADDYVYNFQGRIALSPSIRFGLGGTFFLYVLQPLFEKFCEKIKDKGVNILSIVFAIILVCDCIYTFIIK